MEQKDYCQFLDKNGNARYCFGRFKHNMPSKRWSQRSDMTPQSWTCCDYCINNMKLFPNLDISPYLPNTTHMGNINCDSFIDESNTTVQKNGFKITLDALAQNDYRTISRPLMIPHELQHNAQLGIGIFNIPSTTSFRFGMKSDEYFSFTCERQDGEKMVINDGIKIYYPPKTIHHFDTMATGSNKSLFFIAPEKKDKTEVLKQHLRDGSSSIYEFTITFYERIEVLPMREISDTCRGGGSDNYRGGTRGITSRGGSSSVPVPYNTGSTVAGDKFTSHLSTQNIKKGVKYIEKGKTRLTIQCISTESNEEIKWANLQYKMKDLVKFKLKMSQDTSELEKIKENIEKLQNDQKKKEESIIETQKIIDNFEKENSEYEDSEYKGQLAGLLPLA